MHTAPSFAALTRTLLALVAAALTAACSPGGGNELSELAQQGRQLYQNVCIACHHGDPNRDGALGPAVAGASPELLGAKLLRGEYPPGYSPKRPASNVMPRFPELTGEIGALAAYLREVEADAADAAAD